MRRVKKLMTMISRGEFRKIWRMTISYVYRFFAERRDKRFGGISANAKIPSRYRDIGAHGTQSSDYRCMRYLFRVAPLRADDVFVDVGCGEGRVLTYLYSKGFRGRAAGIELDETVAKTAAERTAACENVTICCGNALEQGELLKDATVVYMFNPFARSVFREFIGLLESVCEKPLRLYYLNSLYADEFEARQRWNCLSSGAIRRQDCEPMPYAVYELRGAEERQDG